MKYLHPYLYEIIHDLVRQRIDGKKAPYVAIMNEIRVKIMSDVSVALDEMERDGLITHSENLNGVGLYRILEERGDMKVPGRAE